MGPANFLGIDGRDLDVAWFVSTTRACYVLATLAGLALLLRWRRPGLLLLGVLLANGLVWLETSYPLARPYAFGVSRDRVLNIGLCQVAAAGHSPLETWQVGQTHFDAHGRPHNLPWVALVALVSGFDTARVFAVYAWLPLVMASGFAAALFYGLGPARPSGAWSGWERAIVAGSATLLASSPTDFLGPYGVPWALMFLLKPNHALGLVLLPFFLRAMAGARTWVGRLLAAAVFNALAWAFVVHAAFAAAGLVAWVVLEWVSRSAEARAALRDAASVLGLNVLLASPLLLVLVRRGSLAGLAPSAALPEGASHLLEAVVRHGGVFALGLWGAVVAFRRDDRTGRLLVGQWAAAVSIWLGYLLLDALRVAEQPDEAFYWLRFLTATLAGVGAWDLAARAAGALGRRALEPASLAVGLTLVALPWTLPYWWDPPRMDRYFPQSREPLAATLEQAGAFLRERTAPAEVLAGDARFAPWAAALAGRRSLSSMGLPAPPDQLRRWEVERILMSDTDAQAVKRAAAEFGVTLLAVTPWGLEAHGLALADLEARAHWRLEALAGNRAEDFVAFFRLQEPRRRATGLAE